LKRTTILIVDDQWEVARAMGRLLAKRFDALPIGDVPTALELVRLRCFDVVLSDMTMPGISGLDLYRIVRAELPDLPFRFLLMTGGRLSAMEARFVASEGIPVLEKPFDLAAVERAIRHVARNSESATAADAVVKEA
jgi:DNA-binding NtrC family response regulator